MKYTWLEDNFDDEIKKIKGIKSITKGNIVVGYRYVDGVQYPIHRKGVEIEFEKEPLTSDIEKIDKLLSKLIRKDNANELT